MFSVLSPFKENCLEIAKQRFDCQNKSIYRNIALKTWTSIILSNYYPVYRRRRQCFPLHIFYYLNTWKFFYHSTNYGNFNYWRTCFLSWVSFLSINFFAKKIATTISNFYEKLCSQSSTLSRVKSDNI